jgi:hypothetical protein
MLKNIVISQKPGDANNFATFKIISQNKILTLSLMFVI